MDISLHFYFLYPTRIRKQKHPFGLFSPPNPSLWAYTSTEVTPASYSPHSEAIIINIGWYRYNNSRVSADYSAESIANSTPPFVLTSQPSTLRPRNSGGVEPRVVSSLKALNRYSPEGFPQLQTLIWVSNSTTTTPYIYLSLYPSNSSTR